VKRVLVIDDDDAVRSAFRLSLDDVGADVVTADSGESGCRSGTGFRSDAQAARAQRHSLGGDRRIGRRLSRTGQRARRGWGTGVAHRRELVTEREQKSPRKDDKREYVLRLYVAGRSANSALALRNLTRFCELWLRGRYELRVIDVLKEPEAAAADGIVATPTLVKHEPAPPERVFGALTNEDELVAIFGIERPAESTLPTRRSQAERR
jgi:circadian clock protein KaiB